MNILSAFKNIRLFVFDVDGVLTDGTITLVGNNVYARKMHTKDGYALQLAIKKGYKVAIISGAQSKEVQERLEKLGVKDVFMGVLDKKGCLQDYLSKHNISAARTLFAGDDMPDLEAMKMAGLSCCPNDAVHQIKQVAHYISPKNGGDAFARELIEKTLTLNHHWNENEDVASQ